MRYQSRSNNTAYIVCSVGKAVYHRPVSANHQNLRTFAALAEYHCEKVYIVVQSPDRFPGVGHYGRVVVIYLPRLQLYVLNHLWFVCNAVLIGLRLSKKDVDLFIASEPTAGGLVCMLMKILMNKPFLLSLQGDLFTLPKGEIPWWRRIVAGGVTRLVCQMADKIRCVSKAVALKAVQAGINPEKLVVVPARCDINQFNRKLYSSEAQRVRNIWEIAKNTRIVLFVGALVNYKGVHYLLHAFSRVLQCIPNTVLLLLGSGDMWDRLHREADALGIANNVRFCGWIPYPEVPVYMAAADVLVLPSLLEGMPRVILEAMAMELPVVASNIAGIPELIKHGENGLLVKPRSSEELATALCYVLEHPEEARRWGVKARALVERSYSFEAGIRAYAAVISDVIEAHRTAKQKRSSR